MLIIIISVCKMSIEEDGIVQSHSHNAENERERGKSGRVNISIVAVLHFSGDRIVANSAQWESLWMVADQFIQHLQWCVDKVVLYGPGMQHGGLHALRCVEFIPCKPCVRYICSHIMRVCLFRLHADHLLSASNCFCILNVTIDSFITHSVWLI